MATLILTAVGRLFGGPVGGAIGAVLGQRVDQRLFAPKGRTGPRLTDLSVQTSSYGSAIPALFGKTRVSGTVIWATDLVETREKVKTGKGQPKQTVYSYAASFAVALSCRRIQRVGRIWADGNLLRGEAGDFKSPATFRLHTGEAGQPVDPLIASAEGVGQCPAYRGLAYAVFEDLQLGDFGNRIPSLSFEVFADDAPVSLGDVAESLAGPHIQANCPTLLDGIAITGSSVRGVLEAITPVIPIHASAAAGGLLLRETNGPSTPISEDDLGTGAGMKAGVRSAHQRLPDTRLPRSLSLSHADPTRDYQPGLQRSWRDVAGRQTEQLECPATLQPAAARVLAERALSARWTSRETAQIKLPWRSLDLKPGACVTCPGLDGQWRIRSRLFEHRVVTLELERTGPGLVAELDTSGGRPVREQDAEHGPTILHLLDLPALTETASPEPTLLVAASGASEGWRRAALSISTNQGSNWTEAGLTALPATLGTVLVPPSPAPAETIDHRNTMTVRLARASDALASTDLDGLLSGTNLALAGGELIQFQTADHLGGTDWRLSGLLRGRRGTEWAINTHSANEAFTLIEAETLASISLPVASGPVSVMALGVGDEAPAVATIDFANAALRPPSPVHLCATELPDGSMALQWVRRSRKGWSWPDHVDAPLGEESEQYRINIIPAPGLPRSEDVSSPAWTYTAAQRATDTANGATQMSIFVHHIGTQGPSRPAFLSWSLD